jgi:2-polyprenyl-3-methyl-5-hydroxy-6-metoxy-1,4-benzoquinol methylase
LPQASEDSSENDDRSPPYRLSRFQNPTTDDVDAETNLEFNRQRWGQGVGWTDIDRFGYRWGVGGVEQTVGGVSAFADQYFRPFTFGNYHLDITELSPGGGRFTAELIRYARSMTLVDMNETCIEICRERFRYFPTTIEYCVNDGRHLDMLRPDSADIIACFDSMVHMHPEIIENYVMQMASIIRPGGIMWLDHSGKGAKSHGHRTDMTVIRMAEIAVAVGCNVISQRFRNEWDCISVIQRPR